MSSFVSNTRTVTDAAFDAHDGCARPIGPVVDLDPEVLESPAGLAPHGARAGADPSREDDRVESTEQRRVGPDLHPHAGAEHVDGQRGVLGAGLAIHEQGLHVSGTG